MFARSGGETRHVDDLTTLGHAHAHGERRGIDPDVEISLARDVCEGGRCVVGQTAREFLVRLARAFVDRLPREPNRTFETLESLGLFVQVADALVECGKVSDLGFRGA